MTICELMTMNIFSLRTIADGRQLGTDDPQLNDRDGSSATAAFKADNVIPYSLGCLLGCGQRVGAPVNPAAR